MKFLLYYYSKAIEMSLKQIDLVFTVLAIQFSFIQQEILELYSK